MTKFTDPAEALAFASKALDKLVALRNCVKTDEDFMGPLEASIADMTA